MLTGGRGDNRLRKSSKPAILSVHHLALIADAMRGLTSAGVRCRHARRSLSCRVRRRRQVDCRSEDPRRIRELRRLFRLGLGSFAAARACRIGAARLGLVAWRALRGSGSSLGPHLTGSISIIARSVWRCSTFAHLRCPPLSRCLAWPRCRRQLPKRELEAVKARAFRKVCPSSRFSQGFINARLTLGSERMFLDAPSAP